MSRDENVDAWQELIDSVISESEKGPAALSKKAPEKYARRLEDMQHPVMITYAVLPAAPQDTQSMLSPAGAPVYLDYDKVEWKALANVLQSAIDELGFPKGIKVYVGDDAFDIWDVSHVKPGTNREVEGYEPVYEAYKCFEGMNFSDFRAGIIKMPRDSRFHVEPPAPGPRTPPSGFFIALRFDRFMQTLDYLQPLTYRLFNVRDSLAVQPAAYRDVPISTILKDWMLNHCGVVAGEEMEIFRMPPVYRGAPD
jgi:hypothetical protein